MKLVCKDIDLTKTNYLLYASDNEVIYEALDKGFRHDYSSDESFRDGIFRAIVFELNKAIFGYGFRYEEKIDNDGEMVLIKSSSFAEINDNVIKSVMMDYRHFKKTKIGSDISHHLQYSNDNIVRCESKVRYETFISRNKNVLVSNINGILPKVDYDAYPYGHTLKLNKYEFDSILLNTSLNTKCFPHTIIPSDSDSLSKDDIELRSKLLWAFHNENRSNNAYEKYISYIPIEKLNIVLLLRAMDGSWRGNPLNWGKRGPILTKVLSNDEFRLHLNNYFKIVFEHIFPDYMNHLKKRMFVAESNSFTELEVINKFMELMGGEEKIAEYPFYLQKGNTGKQVQDVKKVKHTWHGLIKKELYDEIDKKYDLKAFVDAGVIDRFDIISKKEWKCEFKFVYSGTKLEMSTAENVTRSTQFDPIYDLEDIEFLCVDIQFHIRKYENWLKKVQKKHTNLIRLNELKEKKATKKKAKS